MVGYQETSPKCQDTSTDISNDADTAQNDTQHLKLRDADEKEERISATSREINKIKASKQSEDKTGMELKEPKGRRSKNSPLEPSADSEAKESEHGEGFLQILLEGSKVPLDMGVPINSRPLWMDEQKLKMGRDFASKYLFGIVLSEMLSLIFLFNLRGGLEPLIYTGKSDTPYKAFRRYFSTVTRILSWYEGDVFEKDSEAQSNMAAVRTMHSSIYKRMNEASKENLKSLTTLAGHGTGIWSTYLDALKKDFESLKTDESYCPFAEISSLRRKGTEKEGGVLYVNQLDLSLTQFGFMALITLYPEHFGAQDATEEELTGFIHLWRCLGYLLGIKDRYNMCSLDGLEATRERCRVVVEKWVKPSFREVTPEWEHMYRCVVEGLDYYVDGLTFGSSLAYLMWVLDISSTNLLTKMTWYEKVMYSFGRFVFPVIVRIPGCIQIFNWLTCRYMNRVRNASPEWFQRKKDLVYDFQKMTSTSAGTLK